ncbi:MAG: hypothetical protein GVX78_03405 [Bacteroidetes bacterium]|jgi:predicted transcriptional regulator of viral defense system|nr:hypothetical protein [Bacteroidota bacterium]
MGFYDTRKVMAKSTYISENLTDQQIQLLLYLDEYEILYFDLEKLKNELPESLNNINELVENLYHKGFLNRIQRGFYARSHYSNIPVLASRICPGSCLAYWSALHYHGLTERFPNLLFLKATKRKRNTNILGTIVKYVSVKDAKQIGMQREGYGDDSFLITNPEITLIDCFDQTRYAGGFPDLINAFFKARLDSKKLISYSRSYQNTALIKRMGYLASLFHSEVLSDFVEYAKERVNNKYDLFEAGGLDRGVFISEWKLRLNVKKEDLLQMTSNKY